MTKYIFRLNIIEHENINDQKHSIRTWCTKNLSIIRSLQHFILFVNNKKTLKIVSPRTWCTIKPFAYRVAHLLDTF